jgi:hypothetical protein
MLSRIIENLWDVSCKACLGAISTLVGVSDDRTAQAETLPGEVSISVRSRPDHGIKKKGEMGGTLEEEKGVNNSISLSSSGPHLTSF